MRSLRSLFVVAAVLLCSQVVRAESKDNTTDVMDLVRVVANYSGPIKVVGPSDFPDYPVISTKVAFRLTRRTAEGETIVDPTIYVLNQSVWYLQAVAGSINAVYVLASTIAHEAAHGPEGDGTELSALNAQRATLLKLMERPMLNIETRMFIREQLQQIDKMIKREGTVPTIHTAYGSQQQHQ